MTTERYTHGHSPAVLAAHSLRTAQNSAAFLLPQLQDGHRLLDIGCGPGTITVDLADLIDPGEAVGVDQVEAVLDEARALAEQRGQSNVRFECADAYDLPFDDGSFDVVFAHQVLQHLARPVDMLREAHRVLRPGGIVAVRDADYATMVHAPHDLRLDRWLRLYDTVARANGGEPNAGRFLRGWVLEAGFVQDTTTTSTWCYADEGSTATWAGQWAARVTQGTFAGRAVEVGAASKADLEELADAWRSWATQPAAFFAFLHGEVLARKG